MPEDAVYKMIKAFYEKRDELVKLDPGFTPMAKDFVGMQVQRHRRQSAKSPCMQGLAKFLKEHKAWNDKWKVAGPDRSIGIGEVSSPCAKERGALARNFGRKRRYREGRGSLRQGRRMSRAKAPIKRKI